MNTGLFAVINPVAGSCAAAIVQQALRQACTEAKLRYEDYLTTGNDDLASVIQQALDNGHQRIVAAGGDGTVAAVASVLLHGNIPMAILPVGTANLLARELDIPLVLETACSIAASSPTQRHFDTMQIGKQLFLSHISLGVYSKITEKTTPMAKRYFRQIAYIWNAIPELFSKHSWRFELEVDGKRSFPRASFIMIANVGEVGAGELRWGPDIEPDDGKVNICIVRARSWRDYLLLAWHVILNRHKEAPKVSYLEARQSIRIATRKQVPVRGDGEIVGKLPVSIKILPGSLSIIVNQASDKSD